MHLRLLIVLALCIAILTTGCNGRQETDQIAYVITMGIDKSEEKGKINVTYRIAVPRVASSGGGGGQGGGQGGGEVSTLITLKASSLAETRNLLKSAVARSPTLSHIRAIVIGEKMAREGLGDVLGPIMRFREYRGSMYIVIVNQDTAENFMTKNKPKIEALPSRYVETMLLSTGETGYYLMTNLHNFYMRTKSASGAPYVVLAGLSEQNMMDHPSGEKSTLEKTEEYKAGHFPRRGQSNPAEFLGTAVFRGDKMVGTLSNEETRSLAIASGDFGRGFIVVQDPLQPKKGVNVHIRLGRKPKTNLEFVDGRPVIDLDILIEGEITGIPSGINYEAQEYGTKLEEIVSQVIQQQMMTMINKTQALGCDVVGFGYLARAKYQTIKELREVDWPSMYSKAEVKVKVNTKVRRTGLMLKTSPIRGEEGDIERK